MIALSGESETEDIEIDSELHLLCESFIIDRPEYGYLNTNNLIGDAIRRFLSSFLYNHTLQEGVEQQHQSPVYDHHNQPS